MATFPTFSRDVEWEMEESIEDSSVKTTLDSGHVHGRPKFTKDRKIWNGVTCRNLNAADRILYLAFLAEIRGTATTFTWKSPIDDIDYVVRFLQVPALSRLLPGYYQLSFGVMEE
jgi:hypothetical protein